MNFLKIFLMFPLFLSLLFTFPVSATETNPEVPPIKTTQTNQQGNLDCVQQVSPEIKITSWFFGMRNQTQGSLYKYTPTKKVPFKINQDVGFIINVESTKENIPWSYEFELPLPFKGWKNIVDDNRVTVTPDEKMAHVHDVVLSSQGSIEEFWFFVNGDHRGFYRMTVFIDGHKACNFIFEAL